MFYFFSEIAILNNNIILFASGMGGLNKHDKTVFNKLLNNDITPLLKFIQND